MNVSVIIPTYNRENTILRAIESVLKQSYPIHEIIIVDDNSSDNTLDVIEKLSNPKIKYIRNQENKGGAFSRNLGIIKASGDLIAFQDSDDEWLENKLEIQIAELLKNESDVVCCSYNQRFNNKVKKVSNKDVKGEINIYDELLWQNFIGTPTIIAKKEVMRKEMFNDSLPRFQDWELMLRISKRYKVHFVNQSLVNVYIQKNSITVSAENVEKALDIILRQHFDAIKKNPKLLSHYYRIIAKVLRDNPEKQHEFYAKAYELDKRNNKLKLEYHLTKYNMSKVLIFLEYLSSRLKGEFV